MLISKTLIVALLSVVFALSPMSAGAEEVIAQGNLSGKSGHKTTGSISVVKTDAGFEVRLGSSFKLDGAPGPWLGFGNGGIYDKKSEFSKLNGNSGSQIYKLPAKIDVSKYSEFYVWCRPFGVPLGVAKLK